MIITPDSPLFSATLANLPPHWEQVAHQTSGEYAFIARPGGCGLLEAVTTQQATEYTFGGEYDERLMEIDEPEEHFDEFPWWLFEE